MKTPYAIQRTRDPISIDGDLDKPIWQAADRLPRFVDMATGKPALLGTTAAALYDDQNLYVAFWAEEPFPNATLTEPNSLIFNENDLELFIDGGDCYYEFETNALGTVYQVFFIWRDAMNPGSRFDRPEFDLHKAVSFGGDFDRQPATFWRGTHPRGLRWAYVGHGMEGLQTAVRVQGSLNDPTVVSQGWTLEMALPWSSLAILANGRPTPPQNGDEWRMFFGRFQKIAIGEGEVQAAWCATPHGKYDTHMPERFTPVVFRD